MRSRVRGWGVVATAVVLLVSACSSTASPRPPLPTIQPGAGDTIAFERYEEVDDSSGNITSNSYLIYVIKSDGSGLKPLTHGRVDRSPTWSPDGAAIAYVGSCGPDDRMYICRANRDGSGVTRLGDSSDASPTWSADGASIAFLRSAPPSGVYRMRADGSGTVQLTKGFVTTRFDGYLEDEVASLSWSPDGTRIAVVMSGSGECPPSDIGIVKADGSGASPVEHFPPSLTARSVAWSPDGKRLAFGSVHCSDPGFGERDLVVMNADGSEVGAPVRGYGTAWSPDSTNIAIAADDGLYVVNVDGTGLRRVTEAAGSAGALWAPTWSPDGTQLVAGSQHGLFLVNADGTGLRQLTDGNDTLPVWR